MQFDWIFNAQFAGFYQAIEQGYFAEKGLAVELRAGLTTPDTVAVTLSEPMISFGSTESNVLIGDVSEGADVVAIGTMFQDSPMGWMHLKDGPVKEFTDLVNVRVGIHADGSRVIALLLEQQGADTSNLVTFDASYDPQQILDGEADALQCYYIDEFVKLEQLVGENAGVFLARDYGYRAYSQVMFTTASTVDEHPQVVTDFLAAAKKGWQYAFDHPEETVDLILEKYSPELDREYQLRSLAKIEELMVPEPGALFRPMEASVLEAGQQHLLKYDLIPKAVDMDALLAQQHLSE
jgi:ABC-type nitrate/sulfonate/bicarbonate transport system substrate-binding protein